MLLIDRASPTLEWVTIDRPPANALTCELVKQMADYFEDLVKGTDAPGVILSGSGERFFCAGGDIGEVTDNSKIAVPRMHAFHRILVAMEQYGAPIISAVNGYAVGAGIELVLHSDYVVASENAQFGFPEINNGLLPAAKGMLKAVNCLGSRVTEKMLYTGELIDSATALEIGLVNEVVSLSKLHESAQARAELLRAKDIHLFSAIKRTLVVAGGMSNDELEDLTINDMIDYLGRAETGAARERFFKRKAQ